MLDKHTSDYWKNIEEDSVITLKDEQALEQSLSSGEGVEGIDYYVSKVLTLSLNQDIIWKFFILRDSLNEQELWLLAKIVEKDVEVKIYFEVPEFESGSRKDLIDNDYHWLFKEPQDTNNFKYDDLKYSKDIIITSNKGEEVVYKQKKQGELFGKFEDSVFGIVEYDTEQEIENKEILILEIGDGEEGGFVRMLLGNNLNLAEIDVLNSK